MASEDPSPEAIRHDVRIAQIVGIVTAVLFIIAMAGVLIWRSENVYTDCLACFIRKVLP